MPTGIPAVMTTRSPDLIQPEAIAPAIALDIISSVLADCGTKTGCTPHSSNIRRNIFSFGVTATMTACGRYFDTIRAV